MWTTLPLILSSLGAVGRVKLTANEDGCGMLESPACELLVSGFGSPKQCLLSVVWKPHTFALQNVKVEASSDPVKGKSLHLRSQTKFSS